MSKRLVFVSILLLLIAGTGSARSELIEKRKMPGNWSGGAYSFKGTQEFSHCAALAAYVSDTVVIVSIGRDWAWTLGFANPAWRLKDSSVRFSYRFDGGEWFRTTGDVADHEMFTVPMPASDELIRLFMQGRQMDIKFSKGSYSFLLNGTKRLLPELAKCVEDNVKTSPQVSAQPDASMPTPAPEPSSEPTGGLSTGTGFIVNTQGQILTNNHVVKECRELTVLRSGEVARTAQLLRTDSQNDLAVLQAEGGYSPDSVARFRVGTSLRAGESVAAFGFPLAGTLSIAGNISSGVITSLSGLGDDARYLQISAPVQPGNSGGPLMDLAGSVIGVVTSRIDDGMVASATGTIPQNINFALKANVALNFLEAHSIGFVSSDEATERSLADITEQAKRFGVLVICNR
jgi:S1-C subfamily serine protease